MKKIIDNIKQFWHLTKFFWVESYSFISPWKLKDVLYSPIAYFYFMKYCYEQPPMYDTIDDE